MAGSSTFAAVKFHDRLTMRVAGILALGLSALLEGVVCTPFSPNPGALVVPLLLVALLQIGAGLNEWRHDRVLESVVLVAFGLFSCSQISQLFSLATTTETLWVHGSFLLFWGLFAGLVAVQPSDCGRAFHLLLAAIAATLFLKSLLLLLAWKALWPLALVAGGSCFIFAVADVIKHLPKRQS